MLCKGNVVLVPHGEDFRYNLISEWNVQHEHLGRLFGYINGNEDRFNMRVRFGTLQDYFKALESRLEESKEALPTLSGDFFTYADKFDHYWSGYFTSRPFYKHMDRTLQHYVRSADILFSLANHRRQLGIVDPEAASRKNEVEETVLFEMFTQLVEARRALSLFQHHDGVAGTAKSFVMQDYGEKMAFALAYSSEIVERAAVYLMGMARDTVLSIDQDHFVDKLPKRRVLQMNSTLLLFNSLAFEREEVVCVYVPKSLCNIVSFNEKSGEEKEDSEIVPQQVHPVFELVQGMLVGWNAQEPKFELCFLARLPALGFRKYLLKELSEHDVDPLTLVDISYQGQEVNMGGIAQPSKIDGHSKLLELSNGLITASFDSQGGYLRGIKKSGPDTTLKRVHLSFLHYGVREQVFGPSENGSTITSGAYLFLPDGPAKEISPLSNTFVVVKGPVRQSVVVRQSGGISVLHRVDLDVHSEGLKITNLVDMNKVAEVELAMRLETLEPDHLPLDNFYTELNGYQMIRRRRFKRLPIQAHFYPMPGQVFLENHQRRLSLLGRQALGTASLESGTMEVILDRRLKHDDGRGLQEPVLDNIAPTESSFRLLLEEFDSGAPSSSFDKTTPPPEDLRGATTAYPSLLAHHNSLQLHYPVMILVGDFMDTNLLTQTSFLKASFPCDIHLVALRSLSETTQYSPEGEKVSGQSPPTFARPSAALVLHRVGVECRILSTTSANRVSTGKGCLVGKNGKIPIDSLLATGPLDRVANATLTLLEVDSVMEKELELKPMEIKSWQLDF